MRKRSVFLWIIIFLAGILNAQYQGASWPLLYNNGLIKILPDSFVVKKIPDYATGFLANTSISSPEGNLLLFSFGDDVENKLGELVDSGGALCEDTVEPLFCEGGSSGLGNPHLQGALLLPRPGSNVQYYLFIKDEEENNVAQQPVRVTASLIDLSYNNGLGKVLQRAVPILNTTLSDARMTACQHGNGRDWWLINHQYNTNRIYIHLITPDTIEGPFQQDIGLPGLEPDNVGWSTFSPASSLFATTTGGMGGITLLDFDRCSGTFSNLRTINTILGDSGNYSMLAFSPNGRFLYANNSRYLVQYDLQSGDSIFPSYEIVHDTAEYPFLGSMVLMPDGKIYQAGWSAMDSMLSVIDSPNVKCPACGFHLRSVLVPNSVLISSVPNFPNYNLGPLKGSGCDTIAAIQETRAKNEELRIQPNPADKCAYVEMSMQGNYTLQLLNSLGQILETKHTPQVDNFDTEGLADGVYFIQVTDKSTSQKLGIQKLVVQHKN